MTAKSIISTVSSLPINLPIDEEENSIGELNQFRLDALNCHNNYREKHGSVRLQHCKVLSDYAQFWAEKIAEDGKITHSPPQWRVKYSNKGTMLGENIIATNGSKIGGKGMTETWYSQVHKHDFSKDGLPDTQLFTQMIWNESKQVGFGRAMGKNKKWYAVALYHPIGNIEGQFAENIKPAIKKKIPAIEPPSTLIAPPLEDIQETNEVTSDKK